MRRFSGLLVVVLAVGALAGCQKGPRTISSTEEAGKAAKAKRTPRVVSPARQPEVVRLRTIRAFREWGVRETAADALARIGDAAVPALIDTLHDSDQEVRAQAALALARMGDKAAPAVDALVHALDDPNEEVRRGAARALGQIGSEAQEAIPALINAIKDPRNKPHAQPAEVEAEVSVEKPVREP
jgi:HEAT repeat protein